MNGIHRRLPPLVVTDALRKRFWAKVRTSENADCWPWMAAMRNGYGALKIARRVYSCHRVAWILTNGEPEEGMVVAHKCDNRRCCNPAHLELITAKQNNDDARSRIEFYQPVGTECENAKLTEESVAEARSKYVPGVYGVLRLAREFGVSRATMDRALKGETWKHVG